jgi:hypothetical protein
MSCNLVVFQSQDFCEFTESYGEERITWYYTQLRFIGPCGSIGVGGRSFSGAGLVFWHDSIASML